MLCHRPEQWDALDPKALAYLKRRGLMPVYDYIVDKMTGTWEWLDILGIDLGSEEDYEDQDHPLHFKYELAYSRAHEAFGAYNALLVATKDKEINRAIYDWGHYSVFY